MEQTQLALNAQQELFKIKQINHPALNALLACFQTERICPNVHLVPGFLKRTAQSVTLESLVMSMV
jgi:hypothetical protein